MPKFERVLFTRDELYSLVWSKPLTKIAADYGMSSVAFAKHCKKVAVPVPPRGYWTRHAYGHRAKKIGLREPRADTPITIAITKHAAGAALAEVTPPIVVVTDKLRDPHVVVSQFQSLLRTPDGRERDDILGVGHGVFSVARASKDRALRILDALFKALDAGGATVELVPARRERRHTLQVVVPSRPPVELWIVEHLRRTPHVLTDFDKTWGASLAPKFDYAHSGQLVIEIATPSTSKSTRRRWGDTAQTPLEKKLGEVVVGIRRAAEALNVEENERAVQRQHESEQRREVEMLERQHAHEAHLVRELRENATRWRDAENVRRFVDAVGEAMPTERRTRRDRAWLAWAREQANKLDPLARPEEIVKALRSLSFDVD